MKKLITSLLFTSLILSGCSALKKEKISTSGKTQTETKMDKVKIKNDLSGRWIWQAKKDKAVIGMGEFEITDQKSEIKGVTKSLIPGVKAVTGRGGNPNVAAAVIVFPLEGRKEGLDKLTFQVKDANGNVTANEVVVKKDGLIMEGISHQQLSPEEIKLLGKNTKVLDYNWTAVRVVAK